MKSFNCYLREWVIFDISSLSFYKTSDQAHLDLDNDGSISLTEFITGVGWFRKVNYCYFEFTREVEDFF